jgi:hypothetical protein
MNPEQEKKFEMLVKQMNEVHAIVFGVEGQGGLHRWVSHLNEQVQQLSRWQHGINGMKVGIGAAWGVLGAVIIYLATRS